MFTQSSVMSMAENPVQPEDRAADLFFQLSSPDRKRILSELQKENIHLNGLAKRLDMTATETFRQLQRLSDASLIERGSNGKYHLTPYGKLVLESSSSLEFLSKFKEYFREHNAFVLPPDLRARLGELTGCRLVTSNTETLNIVDEMIKTAEKNIDATVFGLEIYLKKMQDRLQEGVKERWLLHESYLTKAKVFFRSAKQLPDTRWSPSVPIELFLNEKVAGVTLPLNEGSSSYYSLFGTDPRFVRWAEDLFDAEWQKAKIWRP